MSFQGLFDIPVDDIAKPKKPRKKSSPSPLSDERGCEYCPLNKVKGIRKIFGKVVGKELALFAQSPGPDENQEGIELTGKAGQWWWNELGKVGLERDEFDIQNVVRCFPADRTEGSYNSYLKMRDPSAKEIKCCSIHTENILPKLKAKQILVLGKVAARALLRSRSIPDNKIFWSEDLKARIYLVDHPSYFARGYAPKERLDAFRQVLSQFASDRGKTGKSLSDPFAFIKAQDYRLVLTKADALKAEVVIRKYAKKGRNIAIDIEDSPVPEDNWGYPTTGQGPKTSPGVSNEREKGIQETPRRVIATGFCPKPGLVFIFVFRHREQKQKDGIEVERIAKGLLEDQHINWALHYGCSDILKLRELEDITIPRKCFKHDTNKSEYLRFPDRKKYGLDACAEARFPEFSGYKLVVVDDFIKAAKDVPPAALRGTRDAQYKYIEKHKLFDMSALSLETLRLYNGADCDLTKRLDISNKGKYKEALLQLYIDLSFILYRMEPNGPYFDYEQNAKIGIIYPARAKRYLAQCKALIGKEDFNPGSHAQVYDAIYEDLGMEYTGKGKPNTQKNTMLTMAREHPFPKAVLDWRGASKAESTYVTSYLECAQLNHDRLRTSWWDTGTRTGRLSSGGGGGGTKQRDPSKVNLQNVHNDQLIQNQLIADKRWKRLYKAIAKILNECVGDLVTAAARIEQWVRDHIPDFRVYLILDYGQIEVRVAAQISGDVNLLADCENSDIHTTVGVTMTGWPAEKISNDKATRTSTKNVHFGILFGSGEDGVYVYVIARTPPDQEAVSREFVHKAFVRYHKRYPGVREMFETQRAFAREHHYVETLFGMRQPLVIKEGEEENEVEYSGDEDENARTSYWGNQCINGPVQGTAHQLLICGLVNIIRQPEKYKVLDTPVMDVHDALYFSVELLQLLEARKKACYLMEKESLKTVKTDFPEVDWKAPIVTEAEAGISIGCKLEINEKTTIGGFLIDWYKKRKKQLADLDKELEECTTS